MMFTGITIPAPVPAIFIKTRNIPPTRLFTVNLSNNFIGSSYTADSSIASALHIPYKLNACKEQFPNADPKSTLADAISTKSKLYTELVALEHRRWNAYMRAQGYIFSGSTDKSSRNDLAKMHHDLVDYSSLTEEVKRLDSKVGTK